eukprot:6745836-Pyramimonas_sp.AAC.1
MACSDKLLPVINHDSLGGCCSVLSGEAGVQNSKLLSSSAPPLSATFLCACSLSGGMQHRGLYGTMTQDHAVAAFFGLDCDI